MTKAETVLLPCPFCQATQEDGGDRVDEDGWSVFCEECGASAPHAPTWKDAVTAWNTRADATRIAELEADKDRLILYWNKAEADATRWREVAGQCAEALSDTSAQAWYCCEHHCTGPEFKSLAAARAALTAYRAAMESGE